MKINSVNDDDFKALTIQDYKREAIVHKNINEIDIIAPVDQKIFSNNDRNLLEVQGSSKLYANSNILRQEFNRTNN